MRTTLELDDRVLAAARSRAQVKRISLGAAVSELALRGLEAREPTPPRPGFPTMASVPGHVITDAMVDDARDD